jgi:hypothetical protein
MDLYFFFKVDQGRIQTFLKEETNGGTQTQTGNQYMVKSAENRMRSNLEGCRTFRSLVVSYQVVSYLDRDVSYRGKNV